MRRYGAVALLLAFWCLWMAAWQWAGWWRVAAVPNAPNAIRLIGRLMARVLWQQSEIFRDTGRWWLVLPLLRVTTF